MIALFQLSLTLSIPLMLMWASYRVAMARRKQLEFNRFMLLGVYLLSVAIAFGVKFFSPVVVRVSKIATVGKASESAVPEFDIMQTLTIVWLSGVILFVAVTLTELLRIYIVMKRSERLTVEGRTVYITDNTNLSPFSFCNRIVLNRNDFEKYQDVILTHERGHIIKRHSFDLMMAQVVSIFCWFNPAAWLLRSDLKTVHEYQADSHVLKSGIDKSDYQLLLIAKASGSKFPAIGNNLNHCKLKSRISMMNNDGYISKASRCLNLIPLLGLICAVFVLMLPVVNHIVTPITTVVTMKSEKKPTLDGTDIYINGTKMEGGALNDVSPNTIKMITVKKDLNRIEIETNDN